MQDYIESLGGYSRSLPKSFTKCLSALKSPVVRRHGFGDRGRQRPATVSPQGRRAFTEEPEETVLSGTEMRAATCGRSRGRELYARLLGRNKSRDRGATLPANIGRLYRQHQAGSETGSCSDLGLAGSGSDPSNYDGEFVDAQSHPCIFHELRELLLPTAPTVQFR